MSGGGQPSQEAGRLTDAGTGLFFVILWLSESINFESVMNSTFIKMKHTSVKTFRRIEKDIITFIVVKFLISFGTGVFTGLFCYLFASTLILRLPLQSHY